MLERWKRSLETYIRDNSGQMTREPTGLLTHPYIVPSSPESPLYSTVLWDWDSWFVSVVLGQLAEDTGSSPFPEYEQGSILNFLDQTDEDGVMPIMLHPVNGPLTHFDQGRSAGFSENMHKPVLAQHAALLSQRTGSAEWLRPHLRVLERFLLRYVESHIHPATGLAYWQSDFAVGVDNDPSVFFRPRKSTASIYLNCLLYREFLAFGALLEQLDDLAAALAWKGRAQDLADAMETHCWDERDGTYYSVDLNLLPVDESDWLHQGAPRRWNSLLLRIDNWSSFLPLWAGFPSEEHAARMVERARDKRTFRATYGIRTLSRLEKMYDLRATNNPSNWLGPVWGISNYLVFRGLQKYGYDADARSIAEETVELFGRDLETTGCLHEYYHPDSGEPIMTPGFQNWNFLALNMIAYLDDRQMVTEF